MFRSSTDTRSLFHDHPHPRHHGLSLFRVALARLRPALYYFTAVVIIIFFYCLFFYEPDSVRHHPHRRFRGHYLGQASALVSVSGSGGETEDRTAGTGHFSAAYLLDEFIRKANLHFADNYARKASLVPTLLGSDELSSSPSLIQPGGNSQHHQRSLLENFRYETVSKLMPNTSANQSLISVRENDVSIHLLADGDGDLAEEDEEYLALVDEPDSIEHYLETLGFNIRHITRYLLHLNQSSNNSTLQVTKGPTSNVVTKPSSTSPPRVSAQSNFSDVLELLNGIPIADSSNNTLVFVSAINANQYSMAYRFIKSFEVYRKKNANELNMHLRLLIYDLGLTEDQLFEIESLCNQTWERSVSTLCKIRQFNFSQYPPHVSDLKIAAYRSIILQEMLCDIRRARRHLQLFLNETAPTSSRAFSEGELIYSIFWIDPHYRFLPDTIRRHPLQLHRLLAETRNISGIRSWSIDAPTSALTHPRMFEYFHTTADNFYFHRMVRSNHLLISISESTWQPFELGIMLPWTRCALTEGCVVPLGSQWRSSCRLDRKPHYRYSGCHHYDMSALNVVLGIAYNFSNSAYSSKPSCRFFAPFYKLLVFLQSTTPSSNSESVNVDQEQSSSSSSVSRLAYENFYYPDYDPGQLERHGESSLESEDRFDRIFTDDDLPEEYRRPAPRQLPLRMQTASSSKLLFHRPSASLLSPLSRYSSSTSPDEKLSHSSNSL